MRDCFIQYIFIYRTLDKTISSLEVELATARAARSDGGDGSPTVAKSVADDHSKERPKMFFVMGIMTAFSSRKRRDSIRETWLPKGSTRTNHLFFLHRRKKCLKEFCFVHFFAGDELKRLETEKGIIMRFVIGHR